MIHLHTMIGSEVNCIPLLVSLKLTLEGHKYMSISSLYDTFRLTPLVL